MKKILLQSRVLSLILFSVFNLLIVQLSVAQDCVTEARSRPSQLVTLKDEVVTGSGKMNAMEMAKIKPYLSRAEKWVETLLTGFTGAKLLYYNSYFPKYLSDAETTDPIFITAGIKGFYQSKMMFFEYYCYDNKYPIETEGESGSTVFINFNNVFAFGFTESEGVYTINGKPAFKVLKKKKTEDKIDYYESRSKMNATGKLYTSDDYIILRNSDNPIFIACTRKEYLQQMLKDVDIAENSNSKFTNELYESNKKMFELEMKVFKENDKSYTAEKEAKRRKWFEEDQEKLKKSISKISPDAIAAKEVILQYLQKPAEWLNRTVKDFYSYGYSKINVLGFLEKLDKERMKEVGEIDEKTAQEIVTINPAYFNKSLSSDVPQVIMVYLRNGYYPHMEKVAALVKKPGTLAPIEAMLNPGKSVSLVLAPTDTVSTCSLNYLPKFKTFTPLVVPVVMKPFVNPVEASYNNVPTNATLKFVLPPISAKLTQLP